MRKYVSKKAREKFESTTRMGQSQNEKKELWVVPRRSYPGQSRRNSFGGAIFRMPKFRSPTTGPPRMFYCVPVMQNNKFLAQSLSELSPLSRLASQKIWKFQTPHRDEKSRSMEIHRKKNKKNLAPFAMRDIYILQQSSQCVKLPLHHFNISFQSFIIN